MSKENRILKINSSVLWLNFKYNKYLSSYNESFNANYLMGRKGRKPTRKKLFFYTASFF